MIARRVTVGAGGRDRRDPRFARLGGALGALTVCALGVQALPGGVAYASPGTVCTWTGGDAAHPTDISYGDNWHTTTGAADACGDLTSTAGSAQLTGAQLVFPATVPAGGSTIVTDAAEAPDDIVFDHSYTLDATNTVTLSGAGNAGIAIDVTGGTATFDGAVSLAASQTWSSAGASDEVVVDGAVSGPGDALTVAGSGTVLLRGANTYSGGTTVSSGALMIGGPSSVPPGTALSVASGALVHLEGYSATVASITGSGTVDGGAASGSSTLTVDGGGSDSFGGTMNDDGTGSLALDVTGNTTLTLSGSALHSGVTDVAAGSTIVDANRSLSPNSSLVVDGTLVIDNDHPNPPSLSGGGSGLVESGSGSSSLTIEDASGTFAGSIQNGSGTMGLFLNAGTLTLSGSSSYTGQTEVAGGTLTVTGSLSASQVVVASGATLDGTGTVHAITATGGTVLPGSATSPGSLTSTGAVDLAVGTGTFGVEIAGPSAATGYSQLVDDVGTVNYDSATLQPSVSYWAPVGATFQIVSLVGGATASGELDYPAGTALADGATFTVDGHEFQITYASTGVTLTNLTAPPSSPPGGTPPPPAPGSSTSSIGGSSSPTGTAAASSGGVSATATGEGSITVSIYPSDPAAAPTFTSSGQYFDVSVSRGDTFSSLTITDCSAEGGTSLEWWNPAAENGAGGWEQVAGDPGPSDQSGCVTVTLTGSSIPSISQLTGTIFAASIPATSAQASTEAYRMVGSDGGVFDFGTAQYYGSMGGKALVAPIVAIAQTPDLAGYWEVASDGGIFAFGDASYYGSMGGKRLVAPVVGMASTPDGKGYWLVAKDGGIFAFGDAAYYGSMGGKTLSQPVVGMAGTPDGGGYWLVAKDGGIFAFGDAGFHGSTGNLALSKPVVSMAPTPDGKGYWLVASDGGIFAFGNAPYLGSMGGTKLAQPVVSMTSTPDGGGYWLVASDGGVFSFGDAAFLGSMGGTKLAAPIVGATG